MTTRGDALARPRETQSFLHVTAVARTVITSCRRSFSSSTCATRSRSVCARTADRAAGGPARGALRGGSDRAGRPGAPERHRHAPRASLKVRKRIPQGGGLGGGSSDAGDHAPRVERDVELRALLSELASLSRPLGADVPVFVQGSSAWAEGTGERLTPSPCPGRGTSSSTPSRMSNPGGVPEP